MPRFFRNNSLTIVMFGLFLITLVGQTITGYNTYNDDRKAHKEASVSYGEYMVSGHYVEAIFENWESEFLQMGLYVLLTVFLKQKGSAESKPLEGEDEVDEDPNKHKYDKDVPWPVRRGGLILKLYENSLTIALLSLFLISFCLHAFGGSIQYCEEQTQHGEQCNGVLGFLGTSQFWFQSFQNWQSEFLSVGMLVILSVFLRQKGSPESKPVAVPHHKTGE